MFLCVILIALTANIYAEPLNCKPIGQQCFSSADCCSLTCPSFLKKCVSNNALQANNKPTASTMGCLSNGNKCRISNECCSKNCSKNSTCSPVAVAVYPAGNSGGNNNINESGCYSIGQRCTYADECCTNRCHSYLHKCVS